MSTSKLNAKVTNLLQSLDNFEQLLEPLLEQTLPETVLGLDTIQQAKLQSLIPYLVYDLVFIYLKSRGVDPKTHPVVGELDRVRQYFDKIKNAETAPTRTATLDKAAASRFIKHAIAQAQSIRPPSEPTPAPSGSSSTPARVPVKVTAKMRERERYHDELAEAGSEERDDELLVYENPEDSGGGGDGAERAGKDKGKQRAREDDPAAGEGPEGESKRRRQKVDPFAGYGDDARPSNEEDLSERKRDRKAKKTKKRKPLPLSG